MANSCSCPHPGDPIRGDDRYGWLASAASECPYTSLVGGTLRPVDGNFVVVPAHGRPQGSHSTIGYWRSGVGSLVDYRLKYGGSH